MWARPAMMVQIRPAEEFRKLNWEGDPSRDFFYIEYILIKIGRSWFPNSTAKMPKFNDSRHFQGVHPKEGKGIDLRSLGKWTMPECGIANWIQHSLLVNNRAQKYFLWTIGHGVGGRISYNYLIENRTVVLVSEFSGSSKEKAEENDLEKPQP